MSKPERYDASNKHLLIATHMRVSVERGDMAPLYLLNAPDYDRVPIDTFLIETLMGTEGRVPTAVHRVVRPNYPSNYPDEKLTPGRRLLYTCWGARTQEITGEPTYKGFAVKMLRDAKRADYRHVVFPGEPAHELVAAFKVACDTLRAWKGQAVSMEPTLLYKALNIEPMVATITSV